MSVKYERKWACDFWQELQHYKEILSRIFERPGSTMTLDGLRMIS